MSRIRRNCPPYILGINILNSHPDGLAANDLSAQLGIHKRNLLEYLKLWKEDNKVYIGRWSRPPGGSGDWVPIYQIKPTPWHKDAEKPKPKSAVQRQQEYRKRHQGVLKARKLLKLGHKDAYNRLIHELMQSS